MDDLFLTRINCLLPVTLSPQDFTTLALTINRYSCPDELCQALEAAIQPAFTNYLSARRNIPNPERPLGYDSELRRDLICKALLLRQEVTRFFRGGDGERAFTAAFEGQFDAFLDVLIPAEPDILSAHYHSAATLAAVILGELPLQVRRLFSEPACT